MILPRIRAALFLLALPFSSGAPAQSKPEALDCNWKMPGTSGDFRFSGRFVGSPLAFQRGLAQLSLNPIAVELGPSAGALQDGNNTFQYTAGLDGTQRLIVATANFRGERPAAGRVTAVLRTPDATFPLQAMIHDGAEKSANSYSLSGIYDGRIDTTKPSEAEFFRDGKRLILLRFSGATPNIYIVQAEGLRRFNGKTAEEGKATGCGPGLCFLTTAAVDRIGLADDCWELEALRRLRDEVLMPTQEGRALVDHYYATAPAIVAAVNARPDASAIWLRTYWTGVVPSAIAARLGFTRLALRRYRAMIAALGGA